MRITLVIAAALLIGIGCARVRVEAPKDPIKVDVAMRLDIYQHVAKDIDSIESLVTGAPEENKEDKAGSQSLLDLFINKAFAQDDLSPEVEQAALRRRGRREDFLMWQAKGAVGEDKSGFLELRLSGSNPDLEALIAAENKDRMIIYKAIAEKNATSLDEVKKLYAKRLQQDAPAGTPIEVFNSGTGSYEWKTK